MAENEINAVDVFNVNFMDGNTSEDEDTNDFLSGFNDSEVEDNDDNNDTNDADEDFLNESTETSEEEENDDTEDLQQDKDDDSQTSDKEDAKEESEDVEETSESVEDEEFDYNNIFKETDKPEFKTKRDEYEYYKSNYEKLTTNLRSENFTKFISDKYKDALIKQEERYQHLKALDEAMQGNPETMAKLYFPDGIKAAGGDPRITTQEQYDLVDRQLKKEFGQNYKDYFNEEDANNNDTISGKMFSRQTELIQELQAKNENLNNNSMTPEQIKEIAYKQKEEQLPDMPTEEFDNLLETAKNFKLDLQSIEKIINFDKHIEKAHQKGIEEGKKKLAKNISNAGKQVKPEPTKKVNEEDDDSKYDDPLSLMQSDDFISNIFK